MKATIIFEDAGRVDVRSLVEAAELAHKAREKHGPDSEHALKFQRMLTQAHKEGKLSYANVRNVGALLGLEKFRVSAQTEEQDEQGAIKKRTITTGAFPAIVSALNLQAIESAYQEMPDPTDELVTDLDDPKKVTFFPLIKTESSAKRALGEVESFPLITASEEIYELHSEKDGRRVELSRALFDENDVTGLIERVTPLAKILRAQRMKRTARAIYDVFGSAATPQQPYALRPKSGVASLYTTSTTALPRAPRGTRINNNPLTDTTALETADAVLCAMLDPDGELAYADANQFQLVVPKALSYRAFKLLNSHLEPGVENETNYWGPQGMAKPRLVTSPIFDAISQTAWMMGDFKRQFRRKWKQRPTFVESGESAESYLQRDVAYQARLSWDFVVGAVDYAFAVQCLAGTTPPSVPAI
jgi:hypothetical protein